MIGNYMSLLDIQRLQTDIVYIKNQIRFKYFHSLAIKRYIEYFSHKSWIVKTRYLICFSISFKFEITWIT